MDGISPERLVESPSASVWSAIDSVLYDNSDTSRRTLSFVAEEVPIAIHYGGFPHAVMMATPNDLDDLAFGFSLTETIIERPEDITGRSIREIDDGFVLDISLTPSSFHRYLATRRVRQLRGHTSCGICGKEDLADIARPQTRVEAGPSISGHAVQAALGALRSCQDLSRRTHAAHAAAWIQSDGTIRTLREDVGRHNALDKLIGAGMRGAFSTSEGFCLITSRCSFEMVQKAIRARFSTLFSISAPTGLAIRTAADAGLTLLSLTREDGRVLYTSPSHLEGLML